MDNVITNLKCFTQRKKKIHLICSCSDEIIHSISHLLYNFLHNRLKVKSFQKTKEKLHPIRHWLRQLADRRVATRTKRKILVNIGVRTILYPIIKDNLLPSLLKTLKKWLLTSTSHQMLTRPSIWIIKIHHFEII